MDFTAKPISYKHNIDAMFGLEGAQRNMIVKKMFDLTQMIPYQINNYRTTYWLFKEHRNTHISDESLYSFGVKSIYIEQNTTKGQIRITQRKLLMLKV